MKNGLIFYFFFLSLCFFLRRAMLDEWRDQLDPESGNVLRSYLKNSIKK